MWSVVSWTVVAILLTDGVTAQDCLDADLDFPYLYEEWLDNSVSGACEGAAGNNLLEEWIEQIDCYEQPSGKGEGNHNKSVQCTESVFIQTSLMAKLQGVEKQECILPPQPVHGRYEPFLAECGLGASGKKWNVGDPVPTNCVLRYTCDQGYKLAGHGKELVTACGDRSSWNPLPSAIQCEKEIIPDKQPNFPTPSTPPAVGCKLPDNADNRIFCPFRCNECTTNALYTSCAYKPGIVVTDMAIKVQCQPGYRLRNNLDYSAVVCIDGAFVADIPDCLRLCPPLESDSLYVTCSYGNSVQSLVDCSKPMLPDTTATYQCKPSYSKYVSLQRKGVYDRRLVCKRDGRWTYDLPECEPVCGISSKPTATIVDGEDTKLGVFPWHAGLYRKDKEGGKEVWTYICGGTLVSDRVVITAAHCVVLSSPNELRVALGKYYRDWTMDEDATIKRDVILIRVPREYNGAVTSYTWDIGLLLLNATVPYTSLVMPVCRDIQQSFDITKGNTGYVVGWGKTAAGGDVSESLLSNNLTMVGYDDCTKLIPKLLAFDKFCGTKADVSVVEKGDSGGGVTAVFGGLHYIFGIVSFKLEAVSVFTNVSWGSHRTWFENEMTSFDVLIK